MVKRLLIVIISLLTLCGCAKDQFAIEREFWRAKKEASNIFINPESSPPNELQRVTSLLNSLAEEYPRTRLALDTQFTVARLYIVKKEYAKARDYLNGLIDMYKDNKAIGSDALFMIGNSYELEDKWQEALAAYKKIINDYPLTQKGLTVPIYIAQRHKIEFQPNKMIQAYQEAIEHYRSLSAQYPGSILAFQTDLLVAEAYAAMNDWQNVAKSLDTMVTAYKDKAKMDGYLLRLAVIYNKELNNKIKAIETLQRIGQEYPDSKLIETADKLIKELEKNG